MKCISEFGSNDNKNGASKLVASSPTPNSHLLLFKIRNKMKDLRISIMKAGQIISKKDRDSIEDWLNDNGVKIHKEKHRYVFQLEVQMQYLKPLVLDCKRRYPQLWKDKLKILCDGNMQLCELFLIEMDNEYSISAPTTRIKPKNKQQEELLKRLYK
jgi:hypothetical protein